MKYLQEDVLSRLTFRLQRSGRGRIISGRVEAYTMKRAGRDKKYAADLGRQQQQQHQQQHDVGLVASSNKGMDTNEQTTTRKRSASFGTGDLARRPARKKVRTISFDDCLLKPADGAVQTLSSRRRLLTDLILTLNMSFPDYDFGNVKASDFEYTKITTVMQQVYGQFAHVLLDDPELLTDLWKGIDQVMNLRECEVYQWKNESGDFGNTFAGDDVPEDEEVVNLVTNRTNDNALSTATDPIALPHAVERTTSCMTSSSCCLLWSFHYLIVNTNLRRILFFSCSERMLPRHKYNDNDCDDDDEVEVYMRENDNVDNTEYDDFDLDPEGVTGGLPILTV